MRLRLGGEALPAKVGVFLLARGIKMESVAELAAFTAAAREYVPALDIPRRLQIVDLPTYAGKQDTFHASVGAAIVAAAGGASIIMHGHDGIPDRAGTAAVLTKLGIP